MTAPDLKSVVWVASYPKSGNTWVRFLVCNLVFGPQESAAALNRLAPDIHELAGTPAPPQGLTFLKTHFPHSHRMPLASNTGGAVYVVRHPADAMLSNYHYARRNGSAADLTLEQYLQRYLTARGDPRWKELGIGAWDDHVSSWQQPGHDFPVLLLRYEDLLWDAAAGARGICAFLGLQRSAQEVAAAVDGCTFERMRQIEESDIAQHRVGIFYKPYLQSSIQSGIRFMRAGRAGEARTALTPEQYLRIEATFGPVMQRLGYDRQAGA
jgi:aryl sulfotransferase